jgi:molecular chaperone DnaK
LKAAYLLGSLLLLAASLHPPTAYSAPGDPPSGSPAGAVYQLPLEQGRSDAAPKGNGGTGAEAGGDTGGRAAGADSTGSATGADESGSLYRSENNFGSSSRVPGVAAARANGSSRGNASGAAAAGGQSAGSAGAGSAAIAGGVIAAETADTGNTSIPASIVLLGAIALLAVAVGILSRRYARR